MKKSYFAMAIAIIFLTITAFVLPQNSSKTIPDDLKSVFKTSCMHCHSQEGSRIAMSAVNFSKWDNYDSDKQAKKAKAIWKVVEKGSMPPKSFIKSNPEASLTDEQKEAVQKWADK